MERHSPKLIGFDHQFVAVVWTDQSQQNGPLEIYSILDGGLEAVLDFRTELQIATEAKFNGGRIAVHGLTKNDARDVVVWDLASGQCVLRCGLDLQLDNPTRFCISFVLEKKRLLLAVNRKFYSAKFWI